MTRRTIVVGETGFLVSLIESGKLVVPETGSQPAVGSTAEGHMLAVMQWILTQLGGVMPEGVEASDGDVQNVFLGDQLLKIKMVPMIEDRQLENECITMRASDKQVFLNVTEHLIGEGFYVASSDVKAEHRWYSVLVHGSLRFAVHLAWRKNPPQKPGVPARQARHKAELLGRDEAPAGEDVVTLGHGQCAGCD